VGVNFLKQYDQSMACKRMNYIFLVGMILIITSSIQGQNLVRNGDFETYNSLPTTISQLHNVKFWNYKIGRGTPDYFHSKAKGDASKSRITAGAPGNWLGFQKPHSGDAYVGIITSIAKDERYTSEFIQTCLTGKLEKGREYYVEFCISVAEGNGLDGIGALFSPILMDSTYSAQDVKKFNPQIHMEVEDMEDLGNGWKKVFGIFKAYGDEKYLLIGNFTDFSLDIRDRFGRIAGDYYSSDYYIDDVWVVGIDEEPVIEIYRKVNFNNVLFEFDRADLLPESTIELDKLIEFMITNPEISVEINGYADSWGSMSYNLALSLRRSKSVAQYIINKGIDSERLCVKGFGFSNPVAENDTNDGREQNRRVEFHVNLK